MCRTVYSGNTRKALSQNECIVSYSSPCNVKISGRVTR